MTWGYSDWGGNSSAVASQLDSSIDVVSMANPFADDLAGQSFVGTAGNDTFANTIGNDTIDGAEGTDTALYGAARSHFTLDQPETGDGYTLTGPGGCDTLQNMERLEFSDISIALDLGVTQSAGATALLVGTVLPGLLALDTESFQGDWLASLASSSAGQLHIGLVGLQQTGLEYA